jgi:hypothetical protein
VNGGVRIVAVAPVGDIARGRRTRDDRPQRIAAQVSVRIPEVDLKLKAIVDRTAAVIVLAIADLDPIGMLGTPVSIPVSVIRTSCSRASSAGLLGSGVPQAISPLAKIPNVIWIRLTTAPFAVRPSYPENT